MYAVFEADYRYFENLKKDLNMHYNHLPIYKSALDLCVTVETIVKEFDKYVKYTIVSDLRAYAKHILFGIHKANRSYDKSTLLERLVDSCEELQTEKSTPFAITRRSKRYNES